MKLGVLGTCAVVAVVVGATPAAAKPGDLIVGDSEAAQVLRIDPKTGAQTVISDDPGLEAPDGIAFDPRGNIYVADYEADGGAVFRIAPNGAFSTVASGDPFDIPAYIDYSPEGNLFVADFSADALFKLDPSGGEPQAFATAVAAPFGVEVAHDASLFASGTAGVFRVDRKTGAAIDIAPGLPAASGLTLAPKGIVYTTDQNDAVFSINPTTRTFSTILDTSPDLDDGFDVTVHPNGFLYLVNNAGVGTIERLDPATGALTEIASESDPGSFLDFPEGIEVEPPKCKGRVANIVGSEKKDKLKGSKFADVIAGLGGKDKIKGVKGNDRLCGGKGKDKLKGGPGKDKLLGQGGKDKLDGGPGKDKERQ